MLTKKQIEKYADVLIWAVEKARGKKFKKYDTLTIQYDLEGRPLAEEVFIRLLKRGMNPTFHSFMGSRLEKAFFEIANDRQLKFLVPGVKELYEATNARIIITAPTSLLHLKDIDSRKINTYAKSAKIYRDILEKREANKEFGWTLCRWPTEACAKEAGLTLKEYTREIAKACYLKIKDPVAKWEAFYKEASKIKNWLTRMNVDHYHVLSDNTDIRIYPGDSRKWVGISGHNVPSFEFFISPDYRHTDGIYYADQPSYVRGNLVKWIWLRFEKGKVVDVDSDNIKFVDEYLSADKGAKYVGEFSLTDKRFSKINKFMASTLFDENLGGKYGNCHIALGNSYLDTYKGDPTKVDKKELGFNDSSIHWDVVNSEKKIVVAYLKSGKEKLIYKNGIFQHGK